MDKELLNKFAAVLEKQTAIIEAMQPHQKAAANVNEAPLLFGDGGLWITPGLEREIITARVKPEGLLAKLPLLGSVMESPIFGAITGVQGDGASPAATPCADNPTGFIKGCNLTAQFGRTAFDTNTIEFDKVMLQVNRGVTTDLRLLGTLLGQDDLNPSGLDDGQILDLVTAAEMIKVGMLFQQGTPQQMGLQEQLWQGTVAGNTPGYAQFPGLDAQIATGQVDAISDIACSALDSDIKDFNYNNVDGSDSNDIVEYLSMLEFFLFYNAQRMGLLPAKWVIAMRPELWQELTAIWPIAYNTNRGAAVLAGNTRMIVDGGDMIAERDRMRDAMTIAINGRLHDVVTDNGIFESNNINDANVPAGSFASSMYMVPLTITGGFPVTFMEYLDYRRGAGDAALLRGKENFWTDRGIFSWAIENNKWCYKLSAKTEERVLLKTPQLAGRIDNVLYAPLQHLRDPFEESPYNQDGGVSLRRTSSTFAVWK